MLVVMGLFFIYIFLASKGDAMLFLIKGFMKYKKDLNAVLDRG